MDSMSIGGRLASSDEPLRCAVFLSGSGSGMEALVLAQRTCHPLHQTVAVVSNRAEVEGVARATRLGVPVEVVEQAHDGHRRSRAEHEEEILHRLEQYDVELIVLSGYMRLLSPTFLGAWQGRVVNIHPSLLPHFPGAHAHRDVLASGTAVSGCTVHLVDEGMDTGAIIAQRIVPVFAEDDEATLSDRVKVEEHRLYPEVLSMIAEGRVVLKGTEVEVRDGQGLRVD